MVGRAAFQEVSGTPDRGKEGTEELRRYLGEGIASLQGRQVEGRGMVAFRSGYLCQVEERACLGRHQAEEVDLAHQKHQAAGEERLAYRAKEAYPGTAAACQQESHQAYREGHRGRVGSEAA